MSLFNSFRLNFFSVLSTSFFLFAAASSADGLDNAVSAGKQKLGDSARYSQEKLGASLNLVVAQIHQHRVVSFVGGTTLLAASVRPAWNGLALVASTIFNFPSDENYEWISEEIDKAGGPWKVVGKGAVKLGKGALGGAAGLVTDVIAYQSPADAASLTDLYSAHPEKFAILTSDQKIKFYESNPVAFAKLTPAQRIKFCNDHPKFGRDIVAVADQIKSNIASTVHLDPKVFGSSSTYPHQNQASTHFELVHPSGIGM